MSPENPILQESPAFLSVRDLRVKYGEREILHGITFDVKAGETLVILGGSGCGKSTLLRTLVGLERPSSGEIWINGKNLATVSEEELYEIRKRTGMSFQGGALFGSMTVGENVALPLREHTKLEDSTIEIMLRLKLEQVGLTGFEYHMPSQLSGGMKKRAAVARALAMDPQVLFFDEPSAGLTRPSVGLSAKAWSPNVAVQPSLTVPAPTGETAVPMISAAPPMAAANPAQRRADPVVRPLLSISPVYDPAARPKRDLAVL
jgi:ABC-type polar amino acid transport system ATPase subunit